MLPLPRVRHAILSVALALAFAVPAAARAAAAAGPGDSAVAPAASLDAPADARAEAMFAASHLPPAAPMATSGRSRSAIMRRARRSRSRQSPKVNCPAISPSGSWIENRA